MMGNDELLLAAIAIAKREARLELRVSDGRLQRMRGGEWIDVADIDRDMIRDRTPALLDSVASQLADVSKLLSGVERVEGRDGRDVEFDIDGRRIGLRYSGDNEFVYTPDLKGEKGDKGDPGSDGIDGNPGKPGRDGKNGRDGKDGTDGRDGKDGTDGKPGDKGDPGRDGRSVEFNVQPTRIGLRYSGDEEFTYTADLKGRSGGVFLGGGATGGGGAMVWENVAW